MAINLEAIFGSAVFAASEVPATSAVISPTSGTGPVSTPFTFVGSGSSANTWAWSFTAVPAGSAIPVGITAYPDSGATTPIDMTDNEVLYHADEASGTTGTDASGNGNDATLTSITVNQTGQVDTAWELTATTSIVTPGSSVTVGSDWTISFWYYNISSNSYATIAYGSASGYHALLLTTTNDLGVWDGSFRDSGADIVRGEAVWRHMAIVGTGGNTLFYLDGVLAGTVTGHQVTVPIVSFMNRPTRTYAFAEKVDELAVWSRALSATEIANIFDLQTGVYARTEDLTFTPDVEGTYTVDLAVTGYDLGVAATDSTTATFTTGTPAAADPGFLTGFLAGFFDEDKFT